MACVLLFLLFKCHHRNKLIVIKYVMFSNEKRALKRIATLLRKTLKNEVITVVAFGSRVRGDFTEESDFDVLVVVKNRNSDILNKIVEIFYKEELKTGIPLSPIVKSQEIFDKEKEFNTAFFRNIKKEGKLLYGKT